jgi:hypothetical protein
VNYGHKKFHTNRPLDEISNAWLTERKFNLD